VLEDNVLELEEPRHRTVAGSGRPKPPGESLISIGPVRARFQPIRAPDTGQRSVAGNLTFWVARSTQPHLLPARFDGYPARL